MNKQHEVRLQARTLDAHTPAEYPWTARVTADKCPRFVPQNATASCNSHGVVKVSWVAVEGAAKYKLDNLAYEGPGGADGDRRYAVAQRNEGETYTFRAAAHTAGDWGGWSNTATITCDPLDPSEPGYPDWQSPNGYRESGCVQGACVNRWVNPPLARLVASEATMSMGAHNCTAARPKNPGGGHTRACTFIWTEPKNIDLTDELVRAFDHSETFVHDEDDQVWHIYKNSDGHAATALHRHCPFRDVNGDGDTEDPEDNDGTCPGPDTTLPDLPWHPRLPNAGDPFWKTALQDGLIAGTVGSAVPAVTVAAMARLGLVAGGTTAGPIGAVVGVVVGTGIGVIAPLCGLAITGIAVYSAIAVSTLAGDVEPDDVRVGYGLWFILFAGPLILGVSSMMALEVFRPKFWTKIGIP